MGGEISTAINAIVPVITKIDPQLIKKQYSMIGEKYHSSVVQTHNTLLGCPVTIYDVVIFQWSRPGSDNLYSRGDITTHAAYPTDYDAQQEINAVWGDYDGS
jgi:hypothetical protein